MLMQTVSTKLYFYGIIEAWCHRVHQLLLLKQIPLKRFLILLLVFATTQKIKAQQTTDSCSTTISLLTCTPGDELYSTFGHSALRVIDRSTGTDVIFNYGSFDFYDPAFYQKFIKGKLAYFVSIDQLNDFLAEYKFNHRGVTNQELNLTCDEKQRFIAALYENAKEENKYYRYDFNYDNCTTRLRDMLEKATGKALQTTYQPPSSNTTFRSLIHDYLDKGQQPWSKLGIDLLLGALLDKKVSNREAMFLPDNLMAAFDNATINGEKLVSEKSELLPAIIRKKKSSFFTPLFTFGILFLLILAMSFLKTKAAAIFLNVFDFIFFLVCGLLGVLLLYMWFGTEHAMTKNNFNLLWALPTHLFATAFLFSKKEWIKNYFRFTSFYSLTLLVAWFILPQQMNIALLPVVGIIMIRSFFISKRN
jgi:hypothetical protein